MRTLLSLAIVVLTAAAGRLPAQDARQPRQDRESPPPVATVTAGVGNSMGWLGAQGERYLARGRLSLFGGVGYTPEIDPGDPTGITFAGGLRGYTGGERHRGFLELSGSQVAVQTLRQSGSGTGNGGQTLESKRLYGPGLQAGYQYMARSGFTAMVSGGAGYAVDATGSANEIQAMLNVGVGYTWR